MSGERGSHISNPDAVSPEVSVTVSNPQATQAAVIYKGESATLDVTMTNAGGGIPLDAKSTLKIFMPCEFFGLDEVRKMRIDAAGWTSSLNEAEHAPFLLLTFSQAGGTACFDSSHPIRFAISNACARPDATPTGAAIRINPGGMAGAPMQVAALLNLLNRPSDSRELPLAVLLDNEHIDDVESVREKPPERVRTPLSEMGYGPSARVLVSKENDPISNDLYLTLMNIREDGRCLYSGTKVWTVDNAPRVIVTFPYGRTSGALAPDDQTATETTSAWNITVQVVDDQGNAWACESPKLGRQDSCPRWVLYPQTTNQGVIGAGSNANVTFKFSHVVSTATGHTQMVLQFSDFRMDEHTQYADSVRFVSITKVRPDKDERGVFRFSGPRDVTVSDPDGTVSFPLQWETRYVYAVRLLLNGNPIPCDGKYQDSSGFPLHKAKDAYVASTPYLQLHSPGLDRDVATFTLQGLAADGGEISSAQWSVPVKGPPRGALSFVAPEGVIQDDCSGQFRVSLKWTIHEAAMVAISYSAQGSAPVRKFTVPYGGGERSGKRETTLSVAYHEVQEHQSDDRDPRVWYVPFTLEAFADEDGRHPLNRLERRVVFRHQCCKGKYLRTNEILQPGDWLQADNGGFVALLEEDGRLAIRTRSRRHIDREWRPCWHSGMAGKGRCCLKLQDDGVLSLLTLPALDRVWQSARSGTKGNYYAVIEDNGNLCVYPGDPQSGSVDQACLWHAVRDNPLPEHNKGPYLRAGSTLLPGWRLQSPNGKYIAILGIRGDFAVYDVANFPDGPWRWHSDTDGKGGNMVTVLEGQLRLFSDDMRLIWSTAPDSTPEIKKCFAEMQDDGNLCIREGDPKQPGPVIWQPGLGPAKRRRIGQNRPLN